MNSKSPLPASALPEAISTLIWQNSSASLPSAISTERAKIQSDLQALDARFDEIERERGALRLRLGLLDDLLAARDVANREAGEAQPPHAAPAAEILPAAAPKGRRKAHKEAAAPSPTSSPSTMMSPGQREERKRAVMDAARRLARRTGGEFSVAQLLDVLRQDRVDLSVRESHQATAVGNIVFHSKDPDLQLVRRGVFRFSGSDRTKAPTTNGAKP